VDKENDKINSNVQDEDNQVGVSENTTTNKNTNKIPNKTSDEDELFPQFVSEEEILSESIYSIFRWRNSWNSLKSV